MPQDEGTPDGDPFDGLVFDEDFVRRGVHEPPARTREAIARYSGQETSWRHPIQPGARPIGSARSRRPLRVRRPSEPGGPTRVPRMASGPGRIIGSWRRQGRRPPKGGLGISWVFLLLAVVFVGSGYASWRNGGSRLAVFGFVVAGWLVSLCFHEFAHALMAYIGGDRSVSVKGYLRLDIRRYANPVFSFVLPALLVLLGGVGLPGGAVWIDHSALRSRRWRSLTSLAGPAANLLGAAACLGPFVATGGTRLLLDGHFSFWAAVAFLGLLQMWALLLNLLPVPGLDGWGVIEPYLRSDIVASARRISPFGFMVVFFLVFSSASISNRLTNFLTSIQGHFNVPVGLAAWGYHLMQFWSKT